MLLDSWLLGVAVTNRTDSNFLDDVFVAVVREKLLGQDHSELETVVVEKMIEMADKVLAMLNFTSDKPGTG